MIVSRITILHCDNDECDGGFLCGNPIYNCPACHGTRRAPCAKDAP